jgi:hypothetical protein
MLGFRSGFSRMPDQQAGEREKGKKLAHPAAEAGQMA